MCIRMRYSSDIWALSTVGASVNVPAKHQSRWIPKVSSF
jgi:hypothetical protein